MNFKSKTALMEHIKELVDNGYLIESWFNYTEEKKCLARKFYTLDTNAVNQFHE